MAAGETAGPSTTLPRFPVEVCGVDQHHAVFFKENRIRGRSQQREVRKYGCAPVGGFDFLLPRKDWSAPQGALQIPPLRFATVGMTRRGRLLSGRIATRMDRDERRLRSNHPNLSHPSPLVIPTGAQRSGGNLQCALRLSQILRRKRSR
jgi:hypothetical protein